MKKFRNVEEITEFFINDGWGENTSFSEVCLKEAKEIGCNSVIRGIKNGKKYFKMNVCGNIFNENGQIVLFNIPCKGRFSGESEKANE